MDIKPDIKIEIKTEPETAAAGDASSGLCDKPMMNDTAVTMDTKTEVKQEPFADSAAAVDQALVAVETKEDKVSTPIKTNKPVKQVNFKPEELRRKLMPVLEELYRQEPDSLPFRQPVDAVLLNIPVCWPTFYHLLTTKLHFNDVPCWRAVAFVLSQDYYDIIKRPMDLSTIKKKLDEGAYKDPWEFIEDQWLMFDNAWLYNRKTSRVYKYASKVTSSSFKFW